MLCHNLKRGPRRQLTAAASAAAAAYKTFQPCTVAQANLKLGRSRAETETCLMTVDPILGFPISNLYFGCAAGKTQLKKAKISGKIVSRLLQIKLNG